MLREIRCERFRVGSISFHPGLNVVLGDSNATNSIGKSILLMIVDFAFGGSSLLDYNTDLVEELGHHHYHITFEFDGELYTFRRGTQDPDNVYRCDEDLAPEAVLSLNEYTAFLGHSYAVDLEDLTFRALVGLYTRVWGKQNLDVRKPLHVVPNQSPSDCVTSLIKAFGQFGSIKDIGQRVAAVESRKRAMSAAVRAAIVPKLGKREYAANNVKIAQLESELESIKAGLAQYATSIADLVNKDVLELKLEKDDLAKLRTPLLGRLKRTQRNLAENRHIKSKHFEGLTDFFPQMDKERLARVEEFHSGLARVLRAELREAEKELTSNLARIDEAIADLEARMAETLESVDEPTFLIDKVYELSNGLRKAREENERFEGEAELRRNLISLQEELASAKRLVLARIQERLNDGMAEIVRAVFGPDRKSPVLTLTERSYSFEVFEDTGTGTAYAGLLVFDLTVLDETVLPVLAHDSLLFKNIENDSVARLVARYPTKGKQAFIALDEIDKYGPATAQMLRERSVIQLDDSSLLYDRDWRVTQEDADA